VPTTKIWWSRLDLNQQCHKTGDLQSPGVTNFPTTPYLVDRRGIEPRPEACKATVLPLSLSAQILATRERFERPSCSFGDCRSANWNYRAIIFNTLFRMCVLKHTVITTILPRLTADVSVQYALIRSDFFMYKNISHPRGRPFVV
jgi:hypothetical protein